MPTRKALIEYGQKQKKTSIKTMQLCLIIILKHFVVLFSKLEFVVINHVSISQFQAALMFAARVWTSQQSWWSSKPRSFLTRFSSSTCHQIILSKPRSFHYIVISCPQHATTLSWAGRGLFIVFSPLHQILFHTTNRSWYISGVHNIATIIYVSS